MAGEHGGSSHSDVEYAQSFGLLSGEGILTFYNQVKDVICPEFVKKL